MDVHIVSILGTLIALVAIASFETHAGNKGERGNLFRQRVLAYAILLLSSTATGIAWCKYPVYGAVHGLATYGAVAVILVERFSRYRIVQPLVVFTILLAFVLFIVMIPVVALPLFESPVLATVPQAPPAEDVDIAFLESSLSKIQGSLHVVRESIDTEAEKIEASISTLTAQLDQKRRELENLNSERARLSEEAVGQSAGVFPQRIHRILEPAAGRP